MNSAEMPPKVIALLQLPQRVGDISGNVQRLAQAARQAWQAGAQIAIAPELAISGYPPEDLLQRPAFLQACEQGLHRLAQELADCTGLALIVGHPASVPDSAPMPVWASALCWNAASLVQDGRVQLCAVKQELPNYGVFDEKRYFIGADQSGWAPRCIEVYGLRVGVLICEDAWFERTALALQADQAQVLVVINASPFDEHKAQEREDRMSSLVRRVTLPLVYVHAVGAQDELVFDGASFALNEQAQVTARARAFQPESLLLQHQAGAWCAAVQAYPDADSRLWQAMVLAVREYVQRNGFGSVVLGLSGGIDSAVVLAVAVEALGAAQVRTVMMPSEYTADISQSDAAIMARRLGVAHDVVAIAPMVQAFETQLAPLFAGRAADVTEENLQARVRGMVLMALSNKWGCMVLTTGNKSELATGYCTLYGDMAGAYAPLKDLCKTAVYRLARWRNQQPAVPGLHLHAVRDDSVADQPQHPHHNDLSAAWVIPDRIITRPPSAELRPDQTDQDSLPPYEVLDAIMALWMQENRSVAEIVAMGYAVADVELVTRLIKINEYKRRQGAPGPRLTRRAFGRDWRYPMTHNFRL